MEPEEDAQTMNVGGVKVDGDKFMELIDEGMDQEAAIEAARVDQPEKGEEETPDDELDAEPDTDEVDGGALAPEDRDRVASVLKRAGWPEERVAAFLDGSEGDREFAIDQAERFDQTQSYIERNVRGRAAETDETDTEESPYRHEEDQAPQALDLDGSNKALFDTLSEELGDESAAALQSLLRHNAGQATARAESQMQEALAPMASFMDRMVRREIGEQFPEILESEAAWKRTCERAKSLATVKDGDVFSLVQEAAAELSYKRVDASSQKAKRQKTAASLEPVTDQHVGTIQPASADEAWDQYFHAAEAGNKDDAARFKALYERLQREGK